MAEACCPDLRDAFAKLEPGHLEIHKSGNELIRLWKEEEPQKAIDYYTVHMLPLADELLKSLAALNKRGVEEITVIRAEGERILRIQYLTTVVVLIAGLLIMVPFSYATARGISHSLHQGVLFAEELQDGNVLRRLNMKRTDEIGVLGTALDRAAAMIEGQAHWIESVANGDLAVQVSAASEDDVAGNAIVTMVNNLRESIGSLAQISARISTGAKEVSTAASTLSSGAQESAASMEQITASMNEISSQTKTNAENAGQARDLAQKATQAASDGQEAMQEMNDAMNRITKNSDEIQRVVKVIDDIAFQRTCWP